jgi:hypothetical protein
VSGGQRCSWESWKTTLRSQGTLSEYWHSDGKKKGDEVDEDDDVVRTSVSQDNSDSDTVLRNCSSVDPKL